MRTVHSPQQPRWEHQMSVHAIQAGGDFRVGDVLARAWDLFTGNILFFLGITFFTYLALGTAIGLFIAPFALVGAFGNNWAPFVVGAILAIFLFLALNTIGEAVLLLGSFPRMRGEPLRVDQGRARG